MKTSIRLLILSILFAFNSSRGDADLTLQGRVQEPPVDISYPQNGDSHNNGTKDALTSQEVSPTVSSLDHQDPETDKVNRSMDTYSDAPNHTIVRMKFSRDVRSDKILHRVAKFTQSDCAVRNSKGDCLETEVFSFNYTMTSGLKVRCLIGFDPHAVHEAVTSGKPIVPSDYSLIVSGRRYLDKIYFQDNPYIHYLSCMPQDEHSHQAVSPRETALIAHYKLGADWTVLTGEGKGVNGIPLKKYKGHTGQGNDPLSPIDIAENSEVNKFCWPVPSTHYISSGYGPRKSPPNHFHYGIDIADKRGGYAINNKPMVAPGPCTVSEIKNSGTDPWVKLDCRFKEQTYQFWYFHFARTISKNIKVGSKLNACEPFALVGARGDPKRITGPHLHLMVTINKKPLNPMMLPWK